MKFIFYLLFLLSFESFGQKVDFPSSMQLMDGVYRGKNMRVINPFAYNSDSTYCVDSILVNRMPYNVDLNTPVIEIKLDSLGFKEWQTIDCTIYYKPNCKPRVID